MHRLFVAIRPPGPIIDRLIDAMEECCRARGVAAIHLEVDHDNPDGKRLYARRGFVDHQRHLMTKWLNR